MGIINYYIEAMGRMHSKGKGISRRCLPYRKAPPSWVHISAQDLTDQMVKLAKRGSTPSQIGVLLRDQYGIPQVKGVTGSKILRILKVNGVAPTLPEDLYHLITKAYTHTHTHTRAHAHTQRPDPRQRPPC